MIGSRPSSSCGRDEHQRLHDLAELGADGRGGLARRCGSTRRSRRSSRVTPLRAAASRTRWIGRVVERVQARPESSIGPPPAPGSIGPVVALILAGGDVPTRAISRPTGRAGPTTSSSSSRRTAARATPRRSASRIDLLGRRRRLASTPDGLAALAAAGVAIERSSTDKDESDTELAIRAALARDADGLVIVGALGGPRIDHALANIGLLAMPELDRHARRSSTRRDRAIRLLRGTGGECDDDGRCLVRSGDLVSLAAARRRCRSASRPVASRYPLRDEPLPLGTPRGRLQRRSRPTRRAGRAAGRAGCSSSRRPLPSDG